MFSISAIAACIPTLPFMFDEVRNFYRKRKIKAEASQSTH